MTINTKLGKEKIELDKDALLQAYFYLDKVFNKDMDSDVDLIYRSVEEATGYSFERTLKKREVKKYDKQK